MNEVILGIAEWQYLLAAMAASVYAVLLLGAARAQQKRQRATGENGSLAETINKAIVRYRLLLLTAGLKVVIGVAALTGHFGTFGFLILTFQPDILLFLLRHEWHSDKEIIRKGREERASGYRVSHPPETPAPQEAV